MHVHVRTLGICDAVPALDQNGGQEAVWLPFQDSYQRRKRSREEQHCSKDGKERILRPVDVNDRLVLVVYVYDYLWYDKSCQIIFGSSISLLYRLPCISFSHSPPLERRHHSPPPHPYTCTGGIHTETRKCITTAIKYDTRACKLKALRRFPFIQSWTAKSLQLLNNVLFILGIALEIFLFVWRGVENMK